MARPADNFVEIVVVDRPHPEHNVSRFAAPTGIINLEDLLHRSNPLKQLLRPRSLDLEQQPAVP